jgi:hypothetical protein
MKIMILEERPAATVCRVWDVCKGASGVLQDDAFDDIGNVLTLIDSGFYHFKYLFPLDDLYRSFSSSNNWAISVRQMQAPRFPGG